MTIMHSKEFDTKYPVIDSDPHFFRVVRYFRPADYATWGVATAAAPALLLGMERMNPVKPRPNLRASLGLATLIGAVGGFLYIYQNTSLRFWGWTENAREVTKDKLEMVQRLEEGKSAYGDSMMPDYVQKESAKYSRYAQLKFSSYPWFNFVNHDYHVKQTAPDASTNTEQSL